MELIELKNEVKSILSKMKAVDPNYLIDENHFNEIQKDYDDFLIDYKVLYSSFHNDYYDDLKQKKDQFENTDQYNIIKFLMKSKKLKSKINKEIKFDQNLKKIKLCNLNAIKKIFTKNQVFCKCKYGLFNPPTHTYSDLGSSIESLLESLFDTLINDTSKEFGFLKDNNKFHKFLQYLNKQEDIDKILKKIELIIENKSIFTIELSEIIDNLKGKYKKIGDFTKKLSEELKAIEKKIKEENTENIEIIFEYEFS